MTIWAQKSLSGWGRVNRANMSAARPEREPGVEAAFSDLDGRSLIAHGAGRSYGDAALNSDNCALLTKRLNRFLSFDGTTGVLTAEPGVTFSDIIATFLPGGFMPPVAPGTGYATLGGGLANDVHGKNHHRVGSLGQHVEWFDLRLPSGERRRVAPESEPELFKATVGGLGLTGIIEVIALKLAAAPSNAVRVRKRRVGDLDNFLDAIDAANETDDYVVGWIDALARGARLGKGVLETASPADENVDDAPRRRPSPPFDFPSFALNALSVRTFNHFYFHRTPKEGSERLMAYPQFLFPLDAIQNWPRIYGKRGFRQFQCVVPFAAGRNALVRMLEATASTGAGSFLAVLKSLGPAGAGYLSFAKNGYTLALDFPNRPGATEFIRQLERIALDHGGRVYLAKDSTLEPEPFAQMYPALGDFRRVIKEFDPEGKMDSDMQRRLRIRGA